MLHSTLTLVNPLGLHARAAAKLVDTTKTFASKIELEFSGQIVDAKSIMRVLMLGAAVDSQLTLHIEGEDESQAMQTVSELIADGFGELDS